MKQESNSNREGLKDRVPGVCKSTHEIKKINDSGGNVNPFLHTLAQHFPTELPRFFQEVQKQETEDVVTIRITYIFETCSLFALLSKYICLLTADEI
jgi:hypothetical protein